MRKYECTYILDPTIADEEQEPLIERFKTLVGDIKYGKDGEWEKPRVLMLQYRNIKGNDLEQFRTIAHEAVLDPPEFKTDTVVAPYVPDGKK